MTSRSLKIKSLRSSFPNFCLRARQSLSLAANSVSMRCMQFWAQQMCGRSSFLSLHVRRSSPLGRSPGTGTTSDIISGSESDPGRDSGRDDASSGREDALSGRDSTSPGRDSASPGSASMLAQPIKQCRKKSSQHLKKNIESKTRTRFSSLVRPMWADRQTDRHMI